MGTQGFSPRTRADAQLIRFGADSARVAVVVERQRSSAEVEVAIVRGESKRVRMNGAVLRAVEELRSEIPTLVFTPDRLVVVKGGPAVRRAYLDRTLSRLLPARAILPIAYGEALGQRNACLRKIGLGLSTKEALSPWDEQVANLGASLQLVRRQAIELLSPRFAAAAAALGLDGCRLEYMGEPLTTDLLAQRLIRDLERGITSCGPHLDEILVCAGSRELRSFGSQGEQRAAVFSLRIAGGGRFGRTNPRPRRSCFSTTSSRSSTAVAGRLSPNASPYSGRRSSQRRARVRCRLRRTRSSA